MTVRQRASIIAQHRQMARNEIRNLNRATAGRHSWATPAAALQAVNRHGEEVLWREEQERRRKEKATRERASRTASTLS